ncbi:hypothetical protein [Sphingomonas limnosediminicola]|jgi:hypothetical protein|uniref:hypothetical protein n=1 Tax=Sphingomonas limnosediminicola TaxID=940133 RepID=UPI0031E3823B
MTLTVIMSHPAGQLPQHLQEDMAMLHHSVRMLPVISGGMNYSLSISVGLRFNSLR